MTVAQAYFAAADLIETHEWGQHCYALDQEGIPVPPNSMLASSYCFIGALMRVTPGVQSYVEALALGYRVLDETLIEWNDEPGRTKADVVAMARAIGRKAEKEGL